MKRVRRNRNNQGKTARRAGFGLLEVLVALAIFSIGIIAVMRLFPSSLRQLRMADERTEASEVAESNLSQIHVATAEALLNRQFLTAGAAMDAVYDAYHLYTGYMTTVSPLRGGDSTYLQRVTFTVQMPDGRQEVYVTYVSKQ